MINHHIGINRMTLMMRAPKALPVKRKNRKTNIA